MKALSKLFVASLTIQIVAASSAFSMPLSGLARPLGPKFINEAQRAVAPFAHVVFCQKSPEECATPGGERIVQLTAAKRRELVELSQRVNREITPQNDGDDDEWSLAPDAGDCEDYAITKRHELINRGWPAAALRLAKGRTSWGEGHLVLVVRTDSGDLVLNNLSGSVVDWRSSGLRWEMIQSSENPRQWYNIQSNPRGAGA